MPPPAIIEDEEEPTNPKLEKLNEHQLNLFRALTLSEQDFCLAVLDGCTPIQAFKSIRTNSENFNVSNSNTEAYKMFTRYRVRAFLTSIREEQEIDNRLMNREEALVILTQMARGNLLDNIDLKSKEVGKDSVTGEKIYQTMFGLKHASEIDRDLFGNVEELAYTKHGIKVKQYSRRQAIADLRAMQGWDKTDKSTMQPVALVPMSVEEFKQARLDMLKNDDC